MAKRIKKKTRTNINLYLSAKDSYLLEIYAKQNSLTEKMAAKKIVKEFLAANIVVADDVLENQLSLFEPIETDIFDFIK